MVVLAERYEREMGEGHGNEATAVLAGVPAISMPPDIDVDNAL